MLVRLYQWVLRPLFPSQCRFTPNCSEYAIEAFRAHGLIRGLGQSLWRVARCGPWTAGGFDPVKVGRGDRRHVHEGTPAHG